MTVNKLVEKLIKLPADANIELLAACGYENIENEIEDVEYDKLENRVILS